MLKLYYLPGACSLAVHVLLEWIGVPYETQEVRHGDPAYLSINPSGAVPALDTGENWILTQDAAILRYLSRRFPQAALNGPDDIRVQAEMDRWAAFFTGDLHPAFFPLFMAQRFTTAKDDAALAAIRDAAVQVVRKRYALLDKHLPGKAFMLGEKRSFLDAYAFPMERWGAAKLPGGLSEFPNILAHHDRIAAEPGVAKALADEGL